MKELIAVNPDLRTKTEFHWVDGKLVIRNAQDAEPIIEANKAEMTDGSDGYSRSRGMRRVASLPLNVWLDLRKRGVLQDKKKFSAWLNDPDNRLFRTAPGRI